MERRSTRIPANALIAAQLRSERLKVPTWQFIHDAIFDTIMDPIRNAESFLKSNDAGGIGEPWLILQSLEELRERCVELSREMARKGYELP